MNRYVLAGGVALVIFAIVSGVILTKRQSSIEAEPSMTSYKLKMVPSPRPEVIEPTIAQVKLTADQPKMLADLVKLGVPLRCPMRGGILVMANGLVRSDSVPEHPGEYGTHMISDGHTTYDWDDRGKTGWVYNDKGLPHSGYTVGNGGGFIGSVDLLDKFNCEKWIPDMSLFELPKDITFTASPRLGGPGM